MATKMDVSLRRHDDSWKETMSRGFPAISFTADERKLMNI